MDEQNKPKEVVTGQSDAVVNSQPAINGNVIPAADSQQTTPLATEQSAPASGVVAQPATNLPAGVSDYSAQIQQMYDAQLAAKQQALETAYNQNLSTMQAARDKIAPTYINQGNDLATQYERTRRANNMQADMNGLNTGAASQMALAQQSNYLDAFGKVRAAQATAEADANREIADLEVSYKSAVAQALADNDYQKATALLAEYQRRDNAAEEMRRYNQQMDLSQAQLRAGYGDFSGFAALYGTETADAMRQYWAYSNPDYAYSMGLISKKEYERITGKTVSGSVSSSGSRSYGGRGGYTGGGHGGGDGNNPNGPGVISPETPAENSGYIPTNGANDEWGSYAQALYNEQKYGSEENALISANGKLSQQFHNQAVQEAQNNGLPIGSPAANKYIEEREADLMAHSVDYQANKSRIGEIQAQKEAERQAQQSKIFSQYGPGGGFVVYDWNAELPYKQAEAAAASASSPGTHSPSSKSNTSNAGKKNVSKGSTTKSNSNSGSTTNKKTKEAASAVAAALAKAYEQMSGKK